MSETVRQSTARTVMVGPVLDADGVAVTDGVVADLKISKNGGIPAALNGSATLTHRHTGHYSLALTASDLDTVGTAQVTIDDTVNAMPPKELTVIEEAVYDALYAASANAWSGAAGSSIGPANMVQLSGDATAADTLELFAEALDQSTGQLDSGSFAADWLTAAGIATGAFTADAFAADALVAATFATGALTADAFAADCFVAANFAADVTTEFQSGLATATALAQVPKMFLTGTAQGGTSSTIQLASATAFGDNILNGCVVKIMSGTGAGQHRVICDYDGSTDTASIAPNWGTNPSSDSVYEIVPASVNIATVPISSSACIALAVANGYLSVDVQSWSGGFVSSVVSGLPRVDVLRIGNSATAATNAASCFTGTITTFDALDTAQDTQHSTTQTAIADVPTVAEFEARTLVQADYFDPAADAVANVTTVGTLTGHTAQTGDSYSLLTTAVADSVPADGTRPSPVQALYMMIQAMTEGAISGTTWTIKKVDGSTTLFTVTLDDDTTPTSKTRSG